MPERMTYLLRTSGKDRRAYGGFQYPLAGPVAAPDWNPAPKCGGGLHGLLMGEGGGRLLDWSPDATWQVLAVDASAVVDLGGKVKVPRAEVVYSGDRAGASAYLIARGADPARMVGAVLTGGDDATLTGGDFATLTGGNYATLTGGYCATLTGGHGAKLTGGDGATLSGGDVATLTARWWDGVRTRVAVAYVGEDGIRPGVPYRVDVAGRWVEVGA